MMNVIRAGTSGDDMINAGNNNNVIVEHDGNDIINSGSKMIRYVEEMEMIRLMGKMEMTD
jgi:Ca2+-binding RTX toxin-like protein